MRGAEPHGSEAGTAPAAPAFAGPTPAVPASEPWGSAPRTTFNRVPGGRSGRHHSDPAQPAPQGLPAAQDAAPPPPAHWAAGPQLPEPDRPGPAQQPPVLLPAPPAAVNTAPAGTQPGGEEPGFSWRTIAPQGGGNSPQGNGNGTHRADPPHTSSQDFAGQPPVSPDPVLQDPSRPGEPLPPRPTARHAYVPAHPAAPNHPRTPMSPLTPPEPAPGQRFPGPPSEQERPGASRPDEPGWDMPLPGSMGSSRPGGG